MTRKHFQVLANALGNDMYQYVKVDEPITIKDIENRYGYTIEAMYECNPAFDDRRFVEAIQVAAERQRKALAEVVGAVV